MKILVAIVGLVLGAVGGYGIALVFSTGGEPAFIALITTIFGGVVLSGMFSGVYSAFTVPVIKPALLKQRLEHAFEQIQTTMLSAKGELRTLHYGIALGVLTSLRAAELITENELGKHMDSLDKTRSQL
ncbi:hypothetical protein QCD61_28385 (plasmid) [Pseudomonas viciae]|uniref:Chemotaxis protein MotA n=1 Tax=Pseudomonas viciae TaxID=2505979 RepID=A0ABY8PML6_9PSED|nr:hypothetical protein [Pseudomonas viciae]WGO96418.1 hypothetical protein QCD61_28385 [Pseudomonas viciae]